MEMRVLVVLCGFAAQTAAHMVNGVLLVNGTDTGLWKHVLKVAAPDNIYGGYDFAGQIVPQMVTSDLYSPNITCGRAAFNSLEQTTIADVIAGEEVGFRVQSSGDIGFYHPGVAQIWLSRAPNDDLKKYHGGGDFFKIAYAGPVDDSHWSLYDDGGDDGERVEHRDFNFTVPRTTPPGAYLMRMEYIFPTSYNYSQLYINCALVNVHTHNATVMPGTPTGFAKFPGAYKIDDLGLLVPLNQDLTSGIPREQLRLTEYKPPGPPIWKG